MLNVGQVEAFAGLNTKGFMTGIDTIHKEGMKASKRIGRQFDQMGQRLQSVGSSMSRWITAPLIGAGGLAVKTAADYEKLRVSMDVLNGSAKEGARNFERLKEFSAGTPFQLSDLASAQNMLQGFGMAADEAFQSIKMIGDISAVSGGSIEGIGIAFGQAAAEGQLMTRDIRQLINQGVPAIKLLADTMNVAESEIFDLASQGEISFEILNKAFQEATSEGGMFADGMKKQAQTIGGVFSTLRDNVSLALGELGDTIVEELDLKEVMRDMISNIQSAVRWFGSLSSEGKRMGIAIAGIAVAAGPTLLVLGSMGRAIGGIMMVLPSLISGMGKLKAVMVANPYIAVATALAAIATHIAVVTRRAANLTEELKSLSNLDTTGTEQEFNRVQKALEGIDKRIEKVKSQHRSMGIIGSEVSEKQLQALQAEKDRLLDLRNEISKKWVAAVDGAEQETEATKTVTRAINEQAQAVERVRIAAEKPIDDIVDPEGILSANQQFDYMNMSMDQLLDLNTQLGPVLDENVKKGEESAQKVGAFGDIMGNALSQATLHGQNLGDVLSGLIKQLASRALVTGLTALLTGGSSLAGGSFLGAVFGGIFHNGGQVPGSGEKMILAEGGEFVLTPQQMAAMQSTGGSRVIRVTQPINVRVEEEAIFRANQNYQIKLDG